MLADTPTNRHLVAKGGLIQTELMLLDRLMAALSRHKATTVRDIPDYQSLFDLGSLTRDELLDIARYLERLAADDKRKIARSRKGRAEGRDLSE
jgi:hypothetical protein